MQDYGSAFYRVGMAADAKLPEIKALMAQRNFPMAEIQALEKRVKDLIKVGIDGSWRGISP